MDSEKALISAYSEMSERLRRGAMRRKRRTHSPECKTKVALATPQGELAMAELRVAAITPASMRGPQRATRFMAP